MIKKITLLVLVFVTLIVEGQEKRYTIKNLSVNNYYSNFGTTFYGEEQVVYASPRKKSYIVKNVWKGNNQPFLDLYVGDIDKDGQLINVKKFSEKLNTRYHEADVAFTKDKKIVYFSRNNYLEGKLTRDSTGMGLIQLYRAKINNVGEWVEEEPMPFNNDHYQTGHPTISADGKTLYFISDMPGGFGKTDIYKAAINADGSIGIPINLGSVVNTPEREMFASISGNDELYFSSDGRKDGYGALDLYVSKITENGLTQPENLGKPINSDKDDFSFILNYENRRGYFSSNRAGGKGDDDIYTFVQDIPIDFKCTQNVKGIVIDKNTGVEIPNAIVTLYDEKGKELQKVVVGNDASYTFDVDCGMNYKLIATKEDYKEDKESFYSTEGKELVMPLELEYVAFKLERGKCIVNIAPIYFDFDKSDIRPDAAIELNKVVEIMKLYPELIIEGGSHTDSRGTFKYNEDLSERRANATVNYIIEQGVDQSRISAKGYGETQLVNGCTGSVNCTEQEHDVNRRTEFVIINFDEVKVKYPGICAIKTISTKEQLRLKKEKELAEKRKDATVKNEFKKRGEEVLLKIENIYFELNSSYLTPESLSELFKVVEIMQKYPQLIIECGSHTDARASDQYNNWLSERRASRVVDYIKSRGIEANRISGKGYGESRLLNHCGNNVKCSELEHLQNRRTEFIIKNPEIINFK